MKQGHNSSKILHEPTPGGLPSLPPTGTAHCAGLVRPGASSRFFLRIFCIFPHAKKHMKFETSKNYFLSRILRFVVHRRQFSLMLAPKMGLRRPFLRRFSEKCKTLRKHIYIYIYTFVRVRTFKNRSKIGRKLRKTRDGHKKRKKAAAGGDFFAPGPFFHDFWWPAGSQNEPKSRRFVNRGQHFFAS